MANITQGLTGHAGLAAAVIFRAWKDTRCKNAFLADDARSWLAGDGRTIATLLCDSIGVPRTALREWYAGGQGQAEHVKYNM